MLHKVLSIFNFRFGLASLITLSLVISPLVAVLASSPAGAANNYNQMTAIGRLRAFDAVNIITACTKAASLTVPLGKARDMSE